MPNEGQSLNLGKSLLMKRSSEKRIAHHCTIIKSAISLWVSTIPLESTKKIVSQQIGEAYMAS